VLVGLAVGGKNRTVTETQRAGQPPVTQTVTQTKEVIRPKVEVHTNTVTTTTSTPSPASSENEARRREAEKNLRTVERENEELKRQLEER
jgi:hypothetical protein